MPDGEEALSYLLVGGRSGTEKPKPVTTPVGSVATSKRKPSYHPRLLDHPMSARPASHPSPRRLASLKGASPSCRELGMGFSGSPSCPPDARYLLDEDHALAHRAVELRAVGQREGKGPIRRVLA
jgi:hypothetical protein